jgi:hypothetical protein
LNKGTNLRKLYATVTLPVVAIAFGIGLAGWAHAQQGQAFTAQLAVLNDSGSTGNAKVTLNGDQLTVEVHTTGLAPSQPHAQHLHIGGQHTCPPASADADGDGIVNTTEGQPFYGPIKVSLTTSGDATDASGLAVDRFPMADATGKLDYSRTFTLPPGVTQADLANAVVVQHGIDIDKSGKYDGAAKSDLDPTLPQEATVPADCGKDVAAAAAAAPTTAAAAPSGVTVPRTGDGTASSTSERTLTLAIFGGIALALAGVAAMGFGVRRNRV